MPLDRAHMTEAERVTLRLYPVAYAAIGLVLMFQPATRTSGPAFEPARLLLPMPVWGLLFVLIAAAEVLALGIQRRRLYIGALTAGAGMAVFWLVLLIYATTGSDKVSYSSAGWVMIAAVAQFASARMLATRGEAG